MRDEITATVELQGFFEQVLKLPVSFGGQWSIEQRLSNEPPLAANNRNLAGTALFGWNRYNLTTVLASRSGHGRSANRQWLGRNDRPGAKYVTAEVTSMQPMPEKVKVPVSTKSFC
jgi:hypothetical protein